jgi:hypothetical protein
MEPEVFPMSMASPWAAPLQGAKRLRRPLTGAGSCACVAPTKPPSSTVRALQFRMSGSDSSTLCQRGLSGGDQAELVGGEWWAEQVALGEGASHGRQHVALGLSLHALADHPHA